MTTNAEVSLNPAQIEDTVGALNDAVSQAFTASDAEAGYYDPQKIKVPRPAFALFRAAFDTFAETYALTPPEVYNGRVEMQTEHMSVLKEFPGLRGVARAVILGSQGKRHIVTGPAIVLSSGSHIALLTAEQRGKTITPMQHSLLDAEYAKYEAKVSSTHSANDVTNAGEIGAALVVASTPEPSRAHHDLHALAKGSHSYQTFGSNFSATGRQDFKVGDKERRPRSAVVPTKDAVLYTGDDDQLPPDLKLFDLELSAYELTVGMTLTATTTRIGRQPNLKANLDNMVGV